MPPLTALSLLVLVPGVALAAGPARNPRADRNGDPLPAGAVARLGSARLLHGGVRHLDFSPDGKTLATCGSDGVRLWDTATGRILPSAHLPAWGDAVFAFMPDGGHLVGDADGCRLVDPTTGKVRRAWAHGGWPPDAVAVSADGTTAAVVWRGGGVTVHHLTRGGDRADWKLADDWTRHLCLSGDGSLLAYARGDEEGTSVLLWDARSSKRLHTLSPEALRPKQLSALCLSRDGRRLAASWDHRVRLWDTASGAAVEGFAEPEGWARFLRFSADGTEVVGGYAGKDLWRWSAATGKELARTTAPPSEKDWYYASVLSPDGRTVAAADAGVVALWDAATWKELVPVARGPAWRGVAFPAPGVVATLASGRKEEVVVAFWDVAHGRPLREHTVRAAKDEWWRETLSPDGTLLAVNNEQRGVLLFDVASGKELRQIDAPRRKDEQAKFAFSPDGTTLVTSDHPRGLLLWDIATGKPLHRLEGDSSGVMAFAPDGRTVASAFVGRFFLTEVAGGKARHRLTLPDSQERERSGAVVERIRFARDGRSVATFGRCDIYVFSTARGRSLLHLGPEQLSYDAAETGDLSPDGRWLAHGDHVHHAVAVRDLNNPRAVGEHQTLFGHAGSIGGMAFSPDGKYLVTCAADGTALVWDAGRLTGRPMPLRPRHPAPELGAVGGLRAEAHWVALADPDAARAGRAMAELEQFPDEALPLLKARLRPAETPPPGRVERLLADLDSDTFAVREAALKELRRHAELAEPALRTALAGKPSAEVTRQAKQLLGELEGPVTDPERLRHSRAVEVLEWVGTPAAREVVEALAKGAPDARLTKEAKVSLGRWPMR